MRDVSWSLRSVTGAVLGGVLVAAALILVGLDPVLSALAGAVVAVDLQYYRGLSGEDGAGGWRDVADNGR